MQNAARRAAARGDHQEKFVIDRERQQAGGGGFDQAIVVERAECARRAVERLEANAERLAQCAQIGFLVERAGGDQDAVGADAEPCRPALGVLDDVAREQRADAIDFRATGLRHVAAPSAPAEGSMEGLAESAPRAALARPIAAVA